MPRYKLLLALVFMAGCAGEPTTSEMMELTRHVQCEEGQHRSMTDSGVFHCITPSGDPRTIGPPTERGYQRPPPKTKTCVVYKDTITCYE